MAAEITILGLGPGSPDLLTKQAWDILAERERIWVRTMHHPTVRAVQDLFELQIESFDHFYEDGESFDQVYAAIVERIFELSDEPDGVVYAVPGDPLVGEATVSALIEKCKLHQKELQLVHGISFIEPGLRLVAVDALEGLFLSDALELADNHHPPFPPDAPAMIGQIYSRIVASDVKLTLLNQYPPDHQVWIIDAAGTEDEKLAKVPLAELDHHDYFKSLTTLLVPAVEKPSAFERFQETVAHLRAPEGCPWDREQTHQSLRSHIMEEAYETLQAIDDDDMDALSEELGDLLLQIVLQTQIATEGGYFRMVDVIAGIQEKLIRRHPHVFADLDVDDVDTVLHNWESLKQSERSETGSSKGLLDGVPITLPALAQAKEIQDRVVRVGFDWPEIEGVIEKIQEELLEVAEAQGVEIESEIGDLLFAVVNYARWLDVDPESALRSANQRFRKRFEAIEESARSQGKQLTELNLDQMEALWEQAKTQK